MPDWNKLKSDAAETLNGIDFNNLTQKGFILGGAALAYLNHSGDMPTIAAIAAQDAPQRTIDNKAMRKAKEELDGAQEYLGDYVATHDQDYLQMAFDETTHSMKFIREMPDNEEKRRYIGRHDEIVAAIKRHGMAM